MIWILPIYGKSFGMVDNIDCIQMMFLWWGWWAQQKDAGSRVNSSASADVFPMSWLWWFHGDFMGIYIYIYVSISLSISISISPSIHLSIHPSIHLSICIYIYIYMYAHGKCRPFLGCWTTLRWIPGSLWTCRGIFSTMAHGWLRCSIFGRWSGPGRDVRKAKLGYAKLCRV